MCSVLFSLTFSIVQNKKKSYEFKMIYRLQGSYLISHTDYVTSFSKTNQIIIVS